MPTTTVVAASSVPSVSRTRRFPASPSTASTPVPNRVATPVAQRPAQDLEIALDRLTNAGLLFCRGVPPHSFYLFKHALVQDAAYGSLLKSRRQMLHKSIAEILEQRFSEFEDTRAPVTRGLRPRPMPSARSSARVRPSARRSSAPLA